MGGADVEIAAGFGCGGVDSSFYFADVGSGDSVSFLIGVCSTTGYVVGA